jgi:histidinol-phosphate aminotransferase
MTHGENMRNHFERGQGEEWLAQRFNRREFGRRAALWMAGACLPFYNEAALAQDIKAIANVPPDAVRINANENPMGPCPAALEAIHKIAPQGGRYLFHQTQAFVETLAAVESIPPPYILPSPGSSDPLHRCVLAFTSPQRPLVIADPGYEAPLHAARFTGAKVIQIPLRKDYSHDAQAMAQADPNAGLIYMCNPNNPTGTVTRKEDLALLIANKPAGCVVLVDEAYFHFSKAATSAIPWITAGKDVIVLRTFSKLYGMAGLRAGAAVGRPELLDKVRGYSGLPVLPTTAMVAAVASLKQPALVPERRKMMADVRDDLFAWMDKRGYSYIPSDANMVLIDSKRPGREAIAALLDHKVAVGRTWAALPQHVRVTIGTRDEMERFKTAFERVMSA